jgi:adenylate cyclase, class 2
MDKQHAWLRLRTDGKESTLTFKKRMGVKSNNGSIPDEGMQEIEILIDNPDKTCEMLKAIGLIVKHEAKNKRVRYFKKDITFDIDFWPQIPPYLEIESNSFGKAKIAARKLGFNPKNALICSTNQVYKKYGYNLGDYSHINFERMIKK